MGEICDGSEEGNRRDHVGESERLRVGKAILNLISVYAPQAWRRKKSFTLRYEM